MTAYGQISQSWKYWKASCRRHIHGYSPESLPHLELGGRTSLFTYSDLGNRPEWPRSRPLGGEWHIVEIERSNADEADNCYQSYISHYMQAALSITTLFTMSRIGRSMVLRRRARSVEQWSRSKTCQAAVMEVHRDCPQNVGYAPEAL